MLGVRFGGSTPYCNYIGIAGEYVLCAVDSTLREPASWLSVIPKSSTVLIAAL